MHSKSLRPHSPQNARTLGGAVAAAAAVILDGTVRRKRASRRRRRQNRFALRRPGGVAPHLMLGAGVQLQRRQDSAGRRHLHVGDAALLPQLLRRRGGYLREREREMGKIAD